jgi:hypothetical protein
MATRWTSHTKPGSTALSARGILILGWLQGWTAVIVFFTTDGRLGEFLGWLVAVPAATLILVGAVATGVQIAQEEDQPPR